MVCCILHTNTLRMKKAILLFALAVLTNLLQAQVIVYDKDLVTPKDLNGVSVKEAGSDSLSTGNVIWIQSELKPHFHATHSEHTYIIDGEGDVLLGDKWFKVKNGDMVFIPKGTIHAVKVTSKRPLKVFAVQSPNSDGTDRVYIKE